MALKIVKKANKKNKKAVITILGTIGGKCVENQGILNENIEPAKYNSLIEEIKDTEAINIFPILLTTYKDYKIIALHTSCAKDIQKKVLNRLYKEFSDFEFKNEWLIEDEEDFDSVFSKIDKLMSGYDEVIIDVTHGFRHLPILLIIDTIIQNIEYTDKIKRIIFAKEIEPRIKYQLIDLKRYLDLANISYILTTFEKDYTVAKNINISDEKLKSLVDNLSQFSKHILANSIDKLLISTKSEPSITEELISNIETLLEGEEEIFKNLERLLNKILTHLKDIDSLKVKIHYEKLFYLSKNMFEKGYLLNSITLLSEAIGMYCSLGLNNSGEDVATIIEEYEKNAIKEKNDKNPNFNLYTLYNQSKVLYRYLDKYKGIFLYFDNVNKKNKEKILKWNEKVSNLNIKYRIKEDEKIKDLIQKIDNIRNNLAHANSSQRLENVEEEIKEVLKEFEDFCINMNILNVKTKEKR